MFETNSQWFESIYEVKQGLHEAGFMHMNLKLSNISLHNGVYKLLGMRCSRGSALLEKASLPEIAPEIL